MLFWGSGTKHKYWDLGNGYQIICVYKYVHFMFIIRQITKKTWHLQGDSRSEDRELTEDEVKHLFHGELPKLSAYKG